MSLDLLPFGYSPASPLDDVAIVRPGVKRVLNKSLARYGTWRLLPARSSPALEHAVGVCVEAQLPRACCHDLTPICAEAKTPNWSSWALSCGK